MPPSIRLPDLTCYSPSAEAWEWQLRGSCRGVDTALFFHPEGERGRAHATREYHAKQVCRGCPVLRQCRDYALRVGEPYGIWGGLGERERRVLQARTVRHAV